MEFVNACVKKDSAKLEEDTFDPPISLTNPTIFWVSVAPCLLRDLPPPALCFC